MGVNVKQSKSPFFVATDTEYARVPSISVFIDEKKAICTFCFTVTLKQTCQTSVVVRHDCMNVASYWWFQTKKSLAATYFWRQAIFRSRWQSYSMVNLSNFLFILVGCLCHDNESTTTVVRTSKIFESSTNNYIFFTSIPISHASQQNVADLKFNYEGHTSCTRHCGSTHETQAASSYCALLL